MAQDSLDKPSYRLWYCPEYPVSVLNTGKPREDLIEARAALRQHIAEHGLVNPLIVLNHRDGGYKKNWVMTGRNRLTVIRELGWDTVPSVVTGECPYPSTEIEWSRISEYFRDGEVYLGNQGPRLRNYSVFDKGEMPECELRAKSGVLPQR